MKIPLVLMLMTIGVVAFAAIFKPSEKIMADDGVVPALISPSAPWGVVEETNTRPWSIICEELGYQEVHEGDIPESDYPRALMEKDIVAVWDAFYDDQHADPDDLRRQTFELSAHELANAIVQYQNEPTDIGGQLPKHPSTHYLLAAMVTKESSVTRDIKMGDLGEVGMLQVHGAALNGYNPEYVHERPWLGLLLGVRWLAIQIATCYPDGYENKEWTSVMWLGPMSIYAAGNRAQRKDGTCGVIGAAKERIDLSNMYRARVESNFARDEY